MIVHGRRRTRQALLLLVAVGSTACRGEIGGSGFLIDTVGGVPSVRNPARGLLSDTVPMNLTQYLLVAGDQLYDRKAAAYAVDVGVLPNGNTVVLDAGNQRVLRFDGDGVYLGSFGGPGQEPGEFVSPFFLEVAGERIYILDTTLNRVTAFDTAGIFLGRFQVGLDGLAGTVPLFAAGAADEIYMAAEPVPFLEEVRDTGAAVLYRLSRSGDIADTVVTFAPTSWARVADSEEQGSFVRPRLAPTPRISASAGAVAVVIGAPYSIEIRQADGSLRRRVLRAYTNVPVTADIRDSVLAGLEERQTSLSREALERIPFAPVVPAVVDLVLDDRGRLWVEAYGEGSTRRDLFDVQGRYLGPVHLPQPIELETVRGDRACGVMGEVTGRSAVACYRVEVRDR